ncbi:MAG: dihydroxyacetone kinase subunit DhaL [Verrucomicrobia bacterium]|nr:dihydroxyacetone kinase subunit DhaL [Verrucomicrobiota bacterium]
MLDAARAQIREQHETLSRLDAAVGDGDHGTTMLRAMDAAAQAANQHADADLQQLLSATGWAVMACDGGSTGPLLGSWFLGMSGASAGRAELDVSALAAVFEGGLTKLQKQSRAQIGDKTLMDALLPAVAALKAADPAQGVTAALAHAADAAARGAADTANMRAKFGRARHLGDRVLGHPDPGAVSVSLIFRGFCEGLAGSNPAGHSNHATQPPTTT